MAQAFVDYMATQGVILTIQQHHQSDVWLADETQAERVQVELARFLENPGDPRYLAASWQSGHTGSGLQYRRFPFWPLCVSGLARSLADYGGLHSGVYRHEYRWRSNRDDVAGTAVRPVITV